MSPPSVTLEADELSHRHLKLGQACRAPKIRQVDDETGRQDLGSEGAQQLHGGRGCTPGCDQVINQNDLRAGLHRVAVHLHLIEAVLQGVGNAYGGVWQLALLADGHEAGRQLVRHRAAEDEAARLDAGHVGDTRARPRLDQLVDDRAEHPRIAQERGDVAEDDSGLGVIRDRADGVADRLRTDGGHGALYDAAGARRHTRVRLLAGMAWSACNASPAARASASMASKSRIPLCASRARSHASNWALLSLVKRPP